MILSRTKDVKRERRTEKGFQEQLRQSYNRTFRIQRNPLENQVKILLRQNNRRYKTIRIRMYEMSIRKRLLQKRNRT